MSTVVLRTNGNGSRRR
uniref:Truncated coat protein n=4 Tax=Cereal yellow dwarf virus (isolate RPV) TaxID=2170100 RepID=R4NIP3_BYDVN|nr:truncated coat protein [Cereal yellow dwarf virus RPV]